jgi:hypothetical protein
MYEELAVALEKRIKRYHTDFSLPLMAEFWEEVLTRSLEDIGLKPEWDNGRSHKVGEDIFEESIGRISCKSGSIVKGSVTLNGSRTTRYKTLEEKLEFLSSSHDDVYFLLAKDKNDIKEKNYKYKVLVFPSSTIKVDTLKWEETKGGWKGTGDFSARISRSMSAQLWTTLPLEKVEHILEIDGNPS